MVSHDQIPDKSPDKSPDTSIDELLDGYLAGKTGELIDPSATVAPGLEARDPREGGVVEVTGLAERAMEGAVVVEEGGRAVYVDGLDSWPAELYRHRVTVTGTLSRRGAGVVPGLATDGGARHGSSGSSRVLVDAKWKLAE